MMRLDSVTEGMFAAVDIHFAKTLMRIVNEHNPLMELVLRQISHASRNGNVCVRVSEMNFFLSRSTAEDKSCDNSELSVQRMDAAAITAMLRASELVGDGSSATPLVLDDSGRVYLYRFWQTQESLAAHIVQKSTPPQTEDTDALQHALQLAMSSAFLVVAGGPGSGKTTMVATVLATLLEQVPSLRIAACAPTGKAAVRLREAIERCHMTEQFTQRFSVDVRDRLPKTVSTIHRMLSPIGTSGRFRFSKERILPLDVVVVDEASMVDIQLMSALFDALPRDAKIILTGDQYQLSSIEPGRVLGDICFGATLHPPPQNEAVARCVVSLQTSHRFDAESGIGRFAAAVNAGNSEKALNIAAGATEPEIEFVDIRSGGARQRLAELAEKMYSPFTVAGDVASKLTAFESVRLLCAANHGEFGVIALNRLVETNMAAAGLLHPAAEMYENKPVLITQNDYTLSLFNGDTGIVAAVDGRLVVAFRGDDQQIRLLPCAMMHHYLPAFAITIHKSQGSEFDHVGIILPDDQPIGLTRELLYTAITRARKKLTLFTSVDTIRHCVSHPTRRAFSLGYRLWGIDEQQ